MKHFYHSLILVIVLASTASAQQNLSANIYTGWLFPFNDFNAMDYEGYRPNLAVGAGMGYNFGRAFRLRGDLIYGSMNGNNNQAYYETDILEPQLGFDVNLLALVTDFDGIKLNLQGGGGLSFYRTSLYNRATGDRLTESPQRSNKALSPNAFISYGGNIGIKLSHKLDLNLGMTNRYIFDNDWMDGFSSGDFSDHYGLAQIGFVYYLKSDRKPGTVEVEDDKFKNLNAEADSAKELRQQVTAQKELVSELEMQQKEQEVAMRSLQKELDSTKNTVAKNYDTVATSGGPAVASMPGNKTAQDILAEPKFRLVVASLPTQQMAQRWIDRSDLDKSEMVIAYIKDLNTHRVVYRSFRSYPAARKELLKIKRKISDAWIVKF
ncbi:MAG: hypothetical protein U5L96_15090 [Owenweeksia sp.]|nr:hypothetical protein [Owenweeksia sp.]